MSDVSKNRSRKFLTRLGVCVLVLVLVLGGCAVYLDLHLFLRSMSQDLDVAVGQRVEAAMVPGAAVAVFTSDQVIFNRGYGFAHVEEQSAVTPDTLFQVASVSKLATATAVMRLYEQGGFQLDDDVNRYLPFVVRNPRFPDDPITFRMLLAHTGGIADGPAYDAGYTVGKSEDPTEPLGEFLQAYFAPGGRYYDADENFTKVAPGEKYAYSNVGFGLLGYLVESISGQPFDVFCRTEVFEPLGMVSSGWFYRDIDKSWAAMPYGYDMLRRTFTPVGYYGFTNYPDGMLKTSTNDFARFLQVFLNEGQTPGGAQFLRPETVAEMLRVQYPQSGNPTGLAWHIDADENLYQHSGGDPGITTLVAISTEKDWGYIIFTNGGGGEGLRSAVGVLKMARDLYPRMLESAAQ